MSDDSKDRTEERGLAFSMLKDEQEGHVETTKKLRQSEEKLRLTELALAREEQSTLHRIRNLERELDRINKVVVSLRKASLRNMPLA